MPKKLNKLFHFWQELKRRRVIHVIVVYVTAAIVIIDLVGNVYETLNLPEWTPALTLIILVIGFPLAIIFSWIYDVTVKGIKKTEALEDPLETNGVHSDKEKPPIPEKSIIVLPFENISPDPDQEYFSDGLTEEIITDLSHIHDMLVISRSSAMTFKGTNNTVKEIVERVNVRYVLEGSVRKDRNNLRITAQLIDSLTDTHLWAEKYNGNLDDVFDIQEKVSRSIVDELKLKLSPEEEQEITESKINNLQAYECYLRARQDFFKYTEDSLNRAEQNLRNGLSIIGENEILYAGLGELYFQFYDSGVNQNEEYLNSIEEFANKIFEIEPNSASAYHLLGLLNLKRENALKAFRNFQRSSEINPVNPDTLLWLIYILCFHLGQASQAAPLINKLRQIDPLSPVGQLSASFNHWMEGRLDIALEYTRKGYNMQSDGVMTGWYLAILMAWNHEYEETYRFIDQVYATNPESILSKVLLLFKYALQNKKTEALPLFTEEIRQVCWNDFGLAWNISECYALIDEKQQSLIWIERAVEWGLINYPLLSKHDPFLQNIRGEERFKKLMKRVKQEWENFEV